MDDATLMEPTVMEPGMLVDMLRPPHEGLEANTLMPHHHGMEAMDAGVAGASSVAAAMSAVGDSDDALATRASFWIGTPSPCSVATVVGSGDWLQDPPVPGDLQARPEVDAVPNQGTGLFGGSTRGAVREKFTLSIAGQPTVGVLFGITDVDGLGPI